MKLLVQKNGLINPNCIKWIIFIGSIIWLTTTLIALYALQLVSSQFYTAIPISQVTRMDVDAQHQLIALSVLLSSEQTNNPTSIYACQVQNFDICRENLQTRMQSSSPLFAYKIQHSIPLLSQFKHIHYGEYLIDEDFKMAVEESNTIFYLASSFQIVVLLCYVLLAIFYLSYYCIFYSGVVSCFRYFLPAKTVVVVPSNSSCVPYLPTNMVYPFEKFFDQEQDTEASTETPNHTVLENTNQLSIPFIIMRMVSSFLKSEESGQAKLETILQWKRAYSTSWNISLTLLWVGMVFLYAALFITAFVLSFFQLWIPIFACLSVLSTCFVLMIHSASSHLMVLLDRWNCFVLMTSQRICKVYHHWWCRSVLLETMLWNEVKQVQTKRWSTDSTVWAKSDDSEIAPILKRFSFFHFMKLPRTIAEEITPLLQSNKQELSQK